MAAASPVPRFFYFRNQCQPGCHVVIAHASRALFYVGLQMENGAVVLRMTVRGQLDQSLLQFTRLASDRCGNRLGLKLAKQRCVTANQPAVEQRDIKLGIVSVQLTAIIQRPDSWAGAKMQIPERLADIRNYLLLRVLAQGRSG